jgi:hypothetical protein
VEEIEIPIQVRDALDEVSVPRMVS